jgi:chromosome segregation ATPase
LVAEDDHTQDQAQARGTEPYLLRERRARHGAGWAEAAGTHRAEAAEATIRTLEAHAASLRERLAAERRWLELDRRNRAEIDRLTRRLRNSERHARELAGRLERVRRELAASDRLLERVRRGHRQLEVLLGQARAALSRLSVLVADASADAPQQPFEAHEEEARIRAYRLAPGDRARDAKPTAGRTSEALAAADAAPDPRADELDAALAVAVERLRRRAVADAGVDTGAQSGAARTSGAPVAMSPSREPLLAASRLSRWFAWRARRRARRQR